MDSSSRYCLTTLCLGQSYESLAAITHPWMKQYARKIGADFRVISNRQLKLGLGHYEKFQVYELLNHYDRIIFMDTDILVTPDCPNLFQVVPEDCFAAFDVSRYTQLHDYAIQTIQEKLGAINWQRDYFNSGMMVFSQLHREALNPNDGLLTEWSRHSQREDDETYLDQTFINYRVRQLRFKLMDLGYRYNHTTAPRNSAQRFQSYILHYPGKGHRKGDKLRQIRVDARILSIPLLYRLLSRFPKVNVLLDRWV